MLALLLASEEPNGVHLSSSIPEVIWGSLAFFVLMIPFVTKGLPAIKKAMAGRTARIRAERAGAESARIEAQSALSASTADLPDVNAEAGRLRTEAVETAARLKTDMVAKAHADAAALKERAAADAENAKRQALADLTAEVSRLTRGATEAVVNDSLDAAAHADLIEKYISQVGQLAKS
jgi:F-type H+-transporting ATPase subunit b